MPVAGKPEPFEGTLYRAIGSGQINHIAILVRGGKLETAVRFFAGQLNWTEDWPAATRGDWGEARFVVPEGPLVRVQLSELKEEQGEGMLPGVHLALGFKDPKEAAFMVKVWAELHGMGEVGIEEVPGGKYFVSIPEIFRTDFEFVPLHRTPSALPREPYRPNM